MSPRGRRGPPWRQHAPPPWWPNDEPWPPHGPPWRHRRRDIRRRFAIFFGVLFLLLAIPVIAAFHATTSQWGNDRDGPPFPWFVPFFWLGLILLIVWTVRRLRRTIDPLADVMEAAARVAEGDYTVRVQADGPGDVRHLIEAFNTMTIRLQANEQQRTHLFSDIAHELRTPLSVVHGTIEGMLDGVYPKDDEHLAPMLDHTRVIARLLNDLQTIATAEAGTLQLYREPTDLAALIGDVAAAFAPVAALDGIQLTTDLTTTPELEIDPVRIRQVLDNLVANALRYTTGGGHIALSLRETDEGIAIEVRDTGRGMTPEEVGRMFERFAKSADSGGSGLGLAIAKSLVDAHGGTITGTSQPGKGTTVTITLPAGATR